MTGSSLNAWPPSTSPCKNDPPANSVGIVIPMRDGLKFFKLCFFSVLNFSDHPFTLCVVDNNSGFETRQYLRSMTKNHPVNVIRYDHDFNFGAEVNLGLRYLFSFDNVRYGLVLQADTVVTPFFLSEMMRVMTARPDVGIVGPLSNNATPEQMHAGQGEAVQIAGRLAGFCMLIRKQAFEDAGGFSEQFVGGGFEDWDFCERAGALGWKSAICRSAYVHHSEGSPFMRQNEDAARRAKENRDIFFARYPKLRGAE